MCMNKKIIVLQFRTDASREHEQKCISDHMGVMYDELDFINVFEKNFNYETLFNRIKEKQEPIILGGSGEFYLIHKDNTKEQQELMDHLMKNICPIINYILEQKIPILGLCFGHQLLGKCLWDGLVDDIQYAETGTLNISLSEAGKLDPIMDGLPNSFKAILGHKTSLVNVPKEFKILASSEKCPVQAIKFFDKGYSFQFHPELNYDDLKERLKLYPEYASNSSDESAEAKPDDIITQTLKNFIKIARS